jgi:glycosyltransferase involved in cell wall biosynthesis
MPSLNLLSISSKDYRDGQVTGGHRRYAEMIRCLSERHQVYLIAPSITPNAKTNNVILLEISESRFKSNLIPNTLVHFLKVCTTALRRLRKKRFDAIVVLATSNALPGLFMRLLWRCKLITFLLEDPSEYRKLIIEGQGLQLSKSRGSRSRFLEALYLAAFRVYERMALLGSDLIIVQSERYRRILSNRYPQKRDAFRVLEANINVSWIEKGVPDNKNISTEAQLLCFVGWLHPRKGLKYLLDAFRILLNGNADIYLEIGGTGPSMQALKEQVCQNQNMQRRITFHGWVEQPMRLIARCDLLVVPSLSDSFPEVISEALYVGTPVIASRVGGIPEQLKYDELLFDPGSVEALVERLQQIIEDDATYKHVRALCNRRREALTFDWGARLQALLEEVS